MDQAADLASAFKALRTAGDTWIPGDLMGITDLQRAFQEVLGSPGFKLLPKPLAKTLKKLSDTTADLLDEGQADLWLTAFRGLRWPGLPAEDSEVPVALVPEGTESPADPGALYPPEYFQQVIQDRALLSQLCDEVKEHLDAAQFSLVDLERDPGNSETVNRVFRSFHTLKSSAAFLGLKNIEEVAHVLEDLLVLIRDGKMAMDSTLTDVIFQGIGVLRDLEAVIETADFEVPVMVEAFRQIDIYPYIRSLHHLLEGFGKKKLGVLLQESGFLTSEGVQTILDVQKREGGKFGEIAVEKNLVPAAAVVHAVQKQNTSARKGAYVKVLNERLNALVDMVGELVVNQSMLRLYVSNPEGGREAAERAVGQLETVTTAIKNLVLGMGMVSVAEIYNKLRVVIRNTASETGRLVTAEFSGEDTELDRNIIETIYDPLVHLVRNAIDHGLEPPADREAAGKARVGRLAVKAEHRGNGIELTIEDDGAGIDRRRVLDKAIRVGLISEAQGEVLKDKEILDLLFLPGFSTRDVATEISGRGVGLDVVRQNIEQIHGKVEIDSTVGTGTRFTIRIPLTLAIIDGFVTRVDEIKYVFPFNIIEEILVPTDSDLTRLEDGNHLVFSRGKHVPVILAGQLFGHQGYAERTPANLQGRLILLISYGEQRYGIAVDGIVGKQEIVIKSLTEALDGVSVFSGGTIFGDGDIGFVVDVEEFIQSARKDSHEDSDR